MSYRVVARSPMEVEADLRRLWSDNLTLGVPSEAKFAWLYRDAPDAADAVLMLETDEGVAVGTNGIVARRFWVGGREVKAAVSADLAVDKPHRALVPALKLVRAFREQVAAKFDLAYGFPNDKAEGVIKRGGFRELGKAVRWARVLRHARYALQVAEREDLPQVVRRAAANPTAARVGGALVDAIRLVADGPDAARAASRHRLKWVAAPDERWDRLWEAARGEYDVVGVRSSRFLRWRCAGMRFAALERRSDGALRAYAAVLLDPDTGAAHVRDLFGHHEDLAAVIDLLVPLAYREGAASLSVRFLGAPKVQGILAKRGFEPREGQRTVVVDVAPSLEGQTATLTDASRWHLFDVDEDA